MLIISFLSLAEPAPVKELLASDETVINPYYMRQLLEYGIKLGSSQSADMSPETLLREAEVRPWLRVLIMNFFLMGSTAPCGRAQINTALELDHHQSFQHLVIFWHIPASGLSVKHRTFITSYAVYAWTPHTPISYNSSPTK